MKVLKCSTATPSCSDAWTQESSRIHSHLPESQLCALGSSRIHSHLHEARKASIALLGHRGYTRISLSLSIALLGHRGHTRISPDLCECPPLAVSLHCDPSQFRHFTKKGCMASVSHEEKLYTYLSPSHLCLSHVLTPSPILTSARRLLRRAPSQRRWLLTPGPGSRGTGQLCIVCHQAGPTNRTHRTQPDS